MKQRYCFALIFLLSSFVVAAQIKLPRLISDGLILQREQPIKIWGWASPQEKIKVSFNNRSYETLANTAGEWELKLPKMKAGGPYDMKLAGKNTVAVKNILIGDVWLCSGQSNMELWMDRLKYTYAKEIATSENTYIRQFLVPDQYNFKAPQQDLNGGSWVAASPATIGDFSGVAYFFAKNIYASYKVPVGIINASLGGSPAEAWISEPALQAFPAYVKEAEKYKDDALIQSVEANDQNASNAWYQKMNMNDAGNQQQYRSGHATHDHWNKLRVPGYMNDESAGAYWFQKDFTVPENRTGKPALLELGRIVDADSVFINGVFIGNTTYQYPPRRYTIPASVLKAGYNHIVIRLVTNNGKGGFVPDKKYEIRFDDGIIDLKGDWFYTTGALMTVAPGQTFIRWKPVGLFNAMIAPLRNLSLKGVLWYQGESNVGKPGEYQALLETLINDWRKQFRQPQLPFIYAQLPNFLEASAVPQESYWAELRQQQLQTSRVPYTAMTVNIDLGEWNDIHPENKKDVGDRMALAAKKLAYGNRQLVASGPVFHSMKIQGNKLVVKFSNIGKGLVAYDEQPLRQFTIAGADGKYVWARAVIKGNVIEVWSDAVDKPVRLRYAWAHNPEGANLYNANGLPASPFEAGL